MKIEQRIKKLEEELNEIKKDIKKDIKFTRIGDLEWSKDLGEMSWDDAMKKAKEIGARLPERWEMVKAYDENKDEIEELIEDSPSYSFWSATETSAADSWTVALSNGTTYCSTKGTLYVVRCVR
jgi:hypothetical protein